MNKQWLSLLVVVLLFSISVHSQDYYTGKLFEAVRSNNLEAAKQAVKKGANANAFDSLGATVLMTAVYYADLPLIQYLVQKGANPHKRGFLDVSGGYLGSVMTIATAQGKLDIFRYLAETCNVSLTEMDTLRDEYSTAWDPLITAVYFRQYPVIEYILNRYPGLKNEILPDAITPLNTAIQIQDLRMAGYLIDKGVDVNLADTVIGRTPLKLSVMYCNENDDTTITRLLLDHGADANSNLHGNYAIDYALENENYRCALMLLRVTELKNLNNWVPYFLEYSSRKGDFKIVDFLIDNGADLHWKDDKGRSLLTNSIFAYDNEFKFDSNNIAMAEYLLSEGLDINAYNRDGSTILLIAIQELTDFTEKVIDGSIDISEWYPDEETVDPDDIQWILDHGADPNLADSISGLTPLMVSILRNQNFVYNLLVKAGADINISDKKGLKPLHYAVNSPVILLDLLKKGVDPNTTDNSLMTPLHYAAMSENTDSTVYQILYAFGAGLDSKDITGRTPVDIRPALKSFHPDLFMYPDWNLQDRIIPLLERAPALFNASDKENHTLLHLAAEYGDTRLAEYLIKHNLSINATDIYSRTPLYVAVNTGNTGMVSWLLEHNADPNIKNAKGESPLSLARLRGMNDISAMLIKKSAIRQPFVTIKPELILPVGHTHRISTITLSRDGSYLLSVSEDNIIKLWEVSSGREIKSYPASFPVHAIALSPDDKTFLADNNMVDISTGAVIRHLNGFSGKIVYRIIAFRDGKNALGITDLGEILLWDLNTGKVLRRYYNDRCITDIALSSDCQYFICGTVRGSLIIYDINKIFPCNTYKVCQNSIRSVCFSRDNKMILSACDDKTVRIIDASDGHLLRIFKWHALPVACFSDDGGKIISGGNDNLLIVWDIATGQKIREMAIHDNRITDICSTPDNKILSAGWDQKIIMSNPETGNVDLVFGGNAWKSLQAKISEDGKYLVSSSINNRIKVWNLETGTSVTSLDLHKRWVIDFIFKPDEDKILSFSDDYSFRLWDLKTGSCDSVLKDNPDFPSFALYSPDSRYLFTYCYARSRILDCLSGKSLWYNDNLRYETNTIHFLSGSKKLVFATSKYSDEVRLMIVDVESGRTLREFNYPEMEKDLIEEKKFDFIFPVNNDKYLLAGGRMEFYPDKPSKENKEGKQVRVFIILLDIESGKTLKVITIEPDQGTTEEYHKIMAALYSKESNDLYVRMSDGRLFRINGDNLEVKWVKDIPYVDRMLTSSDANKLIFYNTSGVYFPKWGEDPNLVNIEILIFDTETGDTTKKLTGLSDWITSSYFSADNRYLITSGEENTIRLWDIENGKELATLFVLDNTDWVVRTPDGLFDASPAAMKGMYYTAGTEIIELSQLKNRYYEPGLLAKLMGFKEEPVRKTGAFNQLELYPEIKAGIDNPNNPILLMNLTNRGGGIGKVVVTINGKEIAEDARGQSINPDAEELELSLNINNHPYLIPGEDNKIEVKAYNADGYLLSRGASVIYQPPAREDIKPPCLYILSCGVSDYTGDAIDLRYAAKDAEDITSALNTGGSRLFGTEHTRIWQMTSNQTDNKLKPYKANLLTAFKQIAGQAQSQDVLVVYLSGHGINWGGQDGDFYYLTMDAYTGDLNAYNDPEIRKNCTISSSELTELIKMIPALKQVLIIDACASGKTVENLMAKRDISSSTLRALDRMKDRVGLHIITGCAADAVSYETSRFGQGLLTYSLLEGMKGIALRENRFVDVNLLFDRSQDRVMELATDIGGIQKPEIFSPYGSQSFDIGELTDEDKSAIPLAQVKPMFLMSSFQEQESLDDILEIEQLVDETFLSMSSRGTDKPLIFINTKEYPEAYRIRGQYSVNGELVSTRVNVFRGKEKITSFTMEGNKNNLIELAEKIALKALEAIPK